MIRRLSFLIALLLTPIAVLLATRPALAAPEAHILRIDPRTGVNNGKPTLTTVLEVVQFKRLSDVLQPCAGVTGAGTLSCWSSNLEKPGALWDPFPFPEANAHLLVKVAGADTLTTFVDKTQWGKAQNQPNVGTAWLVSIDAASSVGSRFGDERAIAHELIQEMQPNDLMDIMFFDDVQVVKDSKWMTYAQRADLANMLNAFKSPMPSHGSNRPLFTEIKNMTQDAFGSLGNSDAPDQVPLHQAMVLLSNGAGRGDPESASPSADVFHQYLDAGRFPADNTSLPKTPLPVISIWLPNPSSFTENIYQNNEAQFMQAISNPEIGGFFDVVREGEGNAKAKTIVGLVKARFNAMWLIHWELSCINPSVEQTFNLVFENTKPAITPDGTFKDVPLGIDPSQWPLDIDMKKTTDAANASPIYPGGQVTVYGNFCWAGDKSRAESYWVPAGTKPPASAAGGNLAQAKAAMQQLQSENMVGSSVQAADGYVVFNVPDDAKVLDGTGDNMVARVVVYDNNAHRASAVDAKNVLTLKATKKPLSLPLIAGIAGLAIVIVLLVMVLVRGGGGGRKRGGATPAGGPGPGAPPGYGGPPGYGAPPQGPGYGQPPPPGGGGYGMMPPAPPSPLSPAQNAMGPPPQAGPFMGAAPPPPQAAPFMGAAPPPPQPQPYSAGSASGLPAPVQVRCPACGMNTMATPGQPSVCFSCGQPLPAEMTKGGGGVAAPGFPLTGAMNAQPLVPPPSPYGAAPPPQAPLHLGAAATIRGPSGQFTVRPGSEVRVGRDPAQCPIFLGEPRISGVHATLRFDAGQLLVRDETSNNGTWIGGSRIAPGVWTPVPVGAPLRFGPIEFAVQLEA
jgi:FHA domain